MRGFESSHCILCTHRIARIQIERNWRLTVGTLAVGLANYALSKAVDGACPAGGLCDVSGGGSGVDCGDSCYCDGPPSGYGLCVPFPPSAPREHSLGEHAHAPAAAARAAPKQTSPSAARLAVTGGSDPDCGYCGVAYQACCVGFESKGFPCGCDLHDGGSGKSGESCGDCGVAYAACCVGFEKEGDPCQCNVEASAW
jgi:hypothetical protein